MSKTEQTTQKEIKFELPVYIQSGFIAGIITWIL